MSIVSKINISSFFLHRFLKIQLCNFGTHIFLGPKELTFPSFEIQNDIEFQTTWGDFKKKIIIITNVTCSSTKIANNWRWITKSFFYKIILEVFFILFLKGLLLNPFTVSHWHMSLAVLQNHSWNIIHF